MSAAAASQPEAGQEILPPLPEAGATGLSSLSAAGIVHDLGNLIQVATSAVNILARGDLPTERSAPILGQAAASLEQAGALVRQTIGLIRNREIAAQDTNVKACLDEVCRLIDARDGHFLLIEVEVVTDLPTVRCDAIGLRSALLNLIFNARDAMAGRGVIRILASPAPPGAAHAVVELSVTDSGVGMSPATLTRVFDPFFTTKDSGLGGVGLSMVERFVRGWGGEIEIESVLGIGTTVILRLPVATPVSTRNFDKELQP